MADDPRATLRSLEQQLRDLAAELAAAAEEDAPSGLAAPPAPAMPAEPSPLPATTDATPGQHRAAPAPVPPEPPAEQATPRRAVVVRPRTPAAGPVDRAPSHTERSSAQSQGALRPAADPAQAAPAVDPRESAPPPAGSPHAQQRPAPASAPGTPPRRVVAPVPSRRPLVVRGQVLELADRIAGLALGPEPPASAPAPLREPSAGAPPSEPPADAPPSPGEPPATAATPPHGPPTGSPTVEVHAAPAGTPDEVLALRDAVAGLPGVADAYLRRAEDGRAVLEVRLG